MSQPIPPTPPLDQYPRPAPATPSPSPRKRPRAWLIVLAVLPLLLIGGLLARQYFSPEKVLERKLGHTPDEVARLRLPDGTEKVVALYRENETDRSMALVGDRVEAVQQVKLSTKTRIDNMRALVGEQQVVVAYDAMDDRWLTHYYWDTARNQLYFAAQALGDSQIKDSKSLATLRTAKDSPLLKGIEGLETQRHQQDLESLRACLTAAGLEIPDPLEVHSLTFHDRQLLACSAIPQETPGTFGFLSVALCERQGRTEAPRFLNMVTFPIETPYDLLTLERVELKDVAPTEGLELVATATYGRFRVMYEFSMTQVFLAGYPESKEKARQLAVIDQSGTSSESLPTQESGSAGELEGDAENQPVTTSAAEATIRFGGAAKGYQIDVRGEGTDTAPGGPAQKRKIRETWVWSGASQTFVEK